MSRIESDLEVEGTSHTIADLVAVTQYTTACCSVQVIDITLTKYCWLALVSSVLYNSKSRKG
jgi:hypothetical protein